MLLVLCLSKILSITQLRVLRDFCNNYSNLLALGVHMCPNGVSREPLAFWSALGHLQQSGQALSEKSRDELTEFSTRT